MRAKTTVQYLLDIERETVRQLELDELTSPGHISEDLPVKRRYVETLEWVLGADNRLQKIYRQCREMDFC